VAENTGAPTIANAAKAKVIARMGAPSIETITNYGANIRASNAFPGTIGRPRQARQSASPIMRAADLGLRPYA
jgi:hypothetical protein